MIRNGLVGSVFFGFKGLADEPYKVVFLDWASRRLGLKREVF